MNPLSVAFALTFAGFVAALATLGAARPAPAVTAAPRGRRRAGDFPDRPAGYRGLRRRPRPPLVTAAGVTVAAVLQILGIAGAVLAGVML